jgi:cytochrome c-type biogenesis protein CcmH
MTVYGRPYLIGIAPAFVMVLCIGILGSEPTYSLIETDQLSSPELSVRYRRLIGEYRCPKCQNQNLAGSDSPISSDLRKQIRRMLEDNYSDEQISDYLVERYGDYILYRPRLHESTYLLWIGPGILLFIALLVSGLVIARQRAKVRSSNIPSSNTLSEQEQQLFNELFKKPENEGDIIDEQLR